jgi:putative peptide zinc metalloprotease protein
MPDHTNHVHPTSSRPVPLRQRPELIVRPHQLGRQRFWVIKDPLALEYHQLRDEEYAVLRMLDGCTSLEEIQANYEAAFAPQKVSLARLQALLGGMHRQGLVIADTADQGRQMLLRRDRKRRRQWLVLFSNVLAIRLPGVSPESFLRWFYPGVRWLFAPWCLAATMLLVVAALVLVAVQYQTVQARLPDVQAFFNPRNLLLLAVTLAATKFLHELGHALSCKHFGGECHEMGLMFLAFTPCLYTNVTDSWMIASKWRRIAISAAGIYVEVVLAAICTFLWWASEPGVVNSLCLNVMFICSVSTVFLNGNPLLRYDGYFVLSDLLEVPNLWQRSRAAVSSLLRRFFLGVELETDYALPRRGRTWLVLYGASSVVYRVFVVTAILWFVYYLLGLYGLESVAAAVAVVVVTSLMLVPAVEFVRFLQDPSVRQRFRRRRLIVVCGLVLSVVAALLLVPMPRRVRVPVFVDARDPQRVYVTEPGTLVRTIHAGTRVEAGQTLAVLESPDLQRKATELQGEIRRARLELKNLVTWRAATIDMATEIAAHIPATEEALADKMAQFEQLRSDQQRLILTAPISGFVLGPPDVAPEAEDDRLPLWWGTPLQQCNLGCHLSTGTLFCLIGDPSRQEAVAYIDQADLEFVRTGQPVRLLLDQLTGRTLRGTIEELAKVDAKVIPRQFVDELDLPMREDKDGVLRPLETLYEARISIEGHNHDLVLGGHGRAKILVDPQPWSLRLWRALNKTFAFRL